MDEIIRQLKTVLRDGDILLGEDVTDRAVSNRGQPVSMKAKAIVRPTNTGEVAAVMKLCHAAGQSVVVHGGLTGLVHGAQSAENDVVLSLERMNRLEEIDEISRTATVQAGIVLQTLHQAVTKAGLMFPLDLGARGSCMLGGNIATNAGGTRVIRYGVTRDLVLGLEVVLADGTIVSSLNKMIKNTAGYDLKQLFIGSEGTLGIVTRAVLRLKPKPTSQDTAFVALSSFENVTSLLRFMEHALGGALSAFEVLWESFYKLVTTEPAQTKPVLPYDYPYYVLIEALGSDQSEDSKRFQQALEQAFENNLIADAAFAHTQQERNAMWSMRDDVDQLWRFTPMFLYDVSLPIKDMRDYIQGVHDGIREIWPDHHFFVFGHIGDGNLHISVSAGAADSDAETRLTVEEIVYKPLRNIGGSVSAEHGIGLEKKAYLSWCRSQAEISLMQSLKKTLDPKGILNPGRVFDLT